MKTAIILIMFSACYANAAVIHVPEDVPSISWAINIAEWHDEIVVADGTYYEWGIEFDRKIFTLAGASDNSSSVVINGLGQDRIMYSTLSSVTCTLPASVRHMPRKTNRHIP